VRRDRSLGEPRSWEKEGGRRQGIDAWMDGDTYKRLMEKHVTDSEELEGAGSGGKECCRADEIEVGGK
jgi:hypothetical protein